MSDKAKILCFLISTMLINMSLMIITPYYPIVAEHRGIPEILIGMVFTMSPLSSCLFSVFIGRQIPRFGPRLVTCAGILMNALALLGLTFCNSFPSNTYFIILSLAMRSLVGFGIACVYIASLSTISAESAEKSHKYSSMMEAFGGLGLMLAPLYASLSFEYIGLSGVFFFLGTALLLALPGIWLCTGPKQDFGPSEAKAQKITNNRNSLQRKCKEIPIRRNMVLDVAILAYAYGAFTFLEPTIAIQLEGMGMEEISIGWAISGMTLVYTLTNFAMACIAHYGDVTWMVNLSAGVCLVSLVLLGPVAHYFELLWLCLAGMLMLGVGAAVAFSSVFPSIAKEIEMSGDKSEAQSQRIYSLFNVGMNLGEITGPVLSGVFAGFTDFSGSCTIIAGIGMGLIVINLKLKQKYDSKSEPLLLNCSDDELVA